MKILMVKLSAIGDVIHTLPALNALRRHYPEAEITWLVESGAAPLIMDHPSLDRLLESGQVKVVFTGGNTDPDAIAEILTIMNLPAVNLAG